MKLPLSKRTEGGYPQLTSQNSKTLFDNIFTIFIMNSQESCYKKYIWIMYDQDVDVIIHTNYFWE